jgi:hypothetical protein
MASKCKRCGNEVVANAAACPQCGLAVSKGSSTSKLVLIGLGGLGLCIFGTCFVGAVGALAGKGSGGAASGASARASEARFVEISTLLSEYRDNEVRADSNFKGHYITTTGLVGDVKRDVMNSIYVTLGTGGRLEVPKVQCFFSDAQAKKAATLSSGTRVTVLGRVDGLMLNVLVRDCEFLSL